jgi:hypothetical protein
MGKHGTEYARVGRDLYRTPHWVVVALGEYIDLRGLSVWEPACGNGRMVEALRQRCDRVYASDIVDYSAGQGEVLDFLSMQAPKLEWPPHLICTNPPFGQSGKLATAFIVTGSSASAFANSSRCCCPAISIPPRGAHAISASARNSSARSCCGSA